MLNQLANGSYYIYQVCDGGCGIVKANSTEEAKAIVVDSYNNHSGDDCTYVPIDVACYRIPNDNRTFKESSEIIELGFWIDAD